MNTQLRVDGAAVPEQKTSDLTKMNTQLFINGQFVDAKNGTTIDVLNHQKIAKYS